MEISRFNTSRLHNEEWFGLHTKYFGLVILCGADVLGIDELFPHYEKFYKEADELMEILRKSFYTTDTSAADRQRLSIFRGFRDAARAFLHTPDTTKHAAGVKVNEVVNQYSKSILSGSLGERTPTIDNFLQDFTGAAGSINLSQEVQLLGLSTWLADLGTANEAYKQALAERIGETMARPEAGRLRQVRVDMDHFYVSMINIVDARLLVIGDDDSENGNGDDSGGGSGSGPVEERTTLAPLPSAPLPSTPKGKIIYFAKGLNAYIAYYKTLLKGRLTRSEIKKGQQDPEDAEDADLQE